MLLACYDIIKLSTTSTITRALVRVYVYGWVCVGEKKTRF